MEQKCIDPLEVDQLITSWRAGNRAAYDDLFALLHEDLRQIAHHLFRRERENHTLQTDDLVNKLYLKMLGARSVPWESYAHFLNALARTMRQILIDHARNWQYRGDGQGKVLLEEQSKEQSGGTLVEKTLNELVALNQAIEKLEHLDPKIARVVNWKLSLGLTLDEIARRLGVSLSSVKREWLVAKKFLGSTIWGMSEI